MLEWDPRDPKGRGFSVMGIGGKGVIGLLPR